MCVCSLTINKTQQHPSTQLPLTFKVIQSNLVTLAQREAPDTMALHKSRWQQNYRAASGSWIVVNLLRRRSCRSSSVRRPDNTSQLPSSNRAASCHDGGGGKLWSIHTLESISCQKIMSAWGKIPTTGVYWQQREGHSFWNVGPWAAGCQTYEQWTIKGKTAPPVSQLRYIYF